MLHSIMPANLENSAGAIGLEKVSFHSNPKEKEIQEGKVVSEEALQVAEERREVKRQGRKRTINPTQ